MEQPRSPLRYLLPRLQDILFILVFYFVLVIGTGLFRDGDPGRHITMGLYILRNHTIPVRDIFSYTMLGQPLTPHEWLAQLVYGAAYSLFNLNGVVLVAGILISLSIILIYRDLLHRQTSRVVALIMALWAASMMSIHWLARPHLFTWVYLALWTPLLLRLIKGKRVPLWIFPVIMLIWANSHGAFIAGFVVWLACLGGWLFDSLLTGKVTPTPVLRNLATVGVSSFAVTFLNPAGWRLWSTSVGYISNRYLVDLTSEYRSPNFHDPASWTFLLFVLVAIILISRSPRKINSAETFLLVGWLMLGLISSRNIPLFAIVSTPILSEYIQPFLMGIPFFKRILLRVDKTDQYFRGPLWSVLGLLLLSTLVLTGHPQDAARQGYHFNEIEFPVGAVNWLELHPQSGNMFNYFPWGGYLIYKMWPQDMVFMDGQLDFYGEKLTRENQEVIHADPGWEKVIDEYQIRWVIVPHDSPLSQVLHILPDWNILYEDSTTLIARKQ